MRVAHAAVVALVLAAAGVAAARGRTLKAVPLYNVGVENAGKGKGRANQRDIISALTAGALLAQSTAGSKRPRYCTRQLACIARLPILIIAHS